MKAGWSRKRLAEVCTLQRGFDLPTKDRKAGTVPLVSSSGIVDHIDQFKVIAPGVVTGRSGSIGNVFFVEDNFWPLNTSLYVKEFFGNDERFVFLLLQSLDLGRFASGTGVPTLNRNHLSDEIVFMPDSREEQRRIVAVLDEAFAAIATVTANAEKNLANARELFASELDALIAEAQTNFPAGPLIDQCLGMTVGHVGPMKDRYEPDGIPFLRSQNVRPFEISFGGMMFIDDNFDAELKKSRLRPGDVAVVRTGYPGTAAVIPPTLQNANCSDLVIIRPGKSLNPHFVAAFLNSNIGKRAVSGELVGAAQKHFNVGSAKQVSIPLPPLEMQAALVDRVAALSRRTDQLAELNQARLHQLTKLKNAILHRAFTGELTATKLEANDNGFKAPAFTANVIALAYRRHLALGTENTFGRVKAQKALHLCESVGMIDLGRSPMKDAAGPNDFQHMLAAEDWAKANQFFEFEPRPTGSGYTFKKLPRFEAIAAEGKAALRPVQGQLEKAIALIVPMKSEQAELLATVHAAWNNLILDGAEPTEEAIIYEARENWHVSKLKFADNKFRDAIATIRAKGIIPDGTAKRVGGQARLL
ncbi:MAG: restriction endonuclease subunit S [Sphingopyxis sp.]|nr:restriction endonuclease subunit S [Sphingopyxis sp.]